MSNNIVSGITNRERVNESQQPYQIQAESELLYNPELKEPTNFVPGWWPWFYVSLRVDWLHFYSSVKRKMAPMETLLVSQFNPFLVGSS